MINLTELMYWRYYGIDYPVEDEEVAVEGTGAEKTKITQTDEKDQVDVERYVLVFVTEIMQFIHFSEHAQNLN